MKIIDKMKKEKFDEWKLGDVLLAPTEFHLMIISLGDWYKFGSTGYGFCRLETGDVLISHYDSLEELRESNLDCRKVKCKLSCK